MANQSKKREGMTRIQSERRKALIEATMQVMTEQGLTGLTLARVASRVGLTAAMINFHFDSKEALLLATLHEVASEFEEYVVSILDDLDGDPVVNLRRFLDVHFHPDLTHPDKVGVWFAFMGDRSARETYMKHFSNTDRRYRGVLRDLIAQLMEKEKISGDPDAMALGLVGMLEIQWQDRLMEPDTFDETAARKTCENYLAILLPKSSS